MNPQSTTTPGDTHMVQDPKRTKMVKIKAVGTIRMMDPVTKKEVSLAPEQTAEVSEEMAAEFCDRTFTGQFAFAGERDAGDAVRHKKVRAVRL